MTFKPCILRLGMVKYYNDCKKSQKTDVQELFCCAYLPFDSR